MKNFGLNELREMYLSFFETKGHLRLPSFSLIPPQRPLASAHQRRHGAHEDLVHRGRGAAAPPRDAPARSASARRDIENIGKTARHGTYFEMLGNFSFGDYFKREAIHWAWEFLTSPDWVLHRSRPAVPERLSR